MGKYEEAGAVYSAILDLRENKEAHFLQGVVYLKQGNLSAAKNHFNEAVKELNRVYKTYGRFATTTGVIRLFESFGFEISCR